MAQIFGVQGFGFSVASATAVAAFLPLFTCKRLESGGVGAGAGAAEDRRRLNHALGEGEPQHQMRGGVVDRWWGLGFGVWGLGLLEVYWGVVDG